MRGGFLLRTVEQITPSAWVRADSVPRRTAAGFTLVEVLVALVITSLLVSILMGALYYMYRVQDSLRREIVVREDELRSKAWFHEVLAGCLPADSASGAQFVGTARTLSCDSVAPLRPQLVTAPQRVTIALERGKEGENLVTYREQGNTESDSLVIARLPEGEGRFSYIGVQGKEVEQWPQNQNDPETLPRNIRLVVKTKNQEEVWQVSLRADPWLEPVFKNPFGIELPR